MGSFPNDLLVKVLFRHINFLGLFLVAIGAYAIELTRNPVKFLYRQPVIYLHGTFLNVGGGVCVELGATD